MKLKHIELVGFQSTAPGAGPTAATAFAGDSLQTKWGKTPILMSAWADQQTAGFQQLIWNSGHDTTRGLRYDVPTTQVQERLPIGVGNEIPTQETISASISGSATAGDIETGILLMGYEELYGSAQRLITFSEMLNRRVNLVTVRASITAGTTGGWSGTETLAADSDLLHGTTDYALLGYVTGSECAAIALRGPDTANCRIGGPGQIESDVTADWFCRLSRAWGTPAIPVINSNNKNSTFVEISNDENALTATVSLIFAQLRK